MSYVSGELFASAAPFYARYRPGYPSTLFDELASRFGLDGTQVAADIGCGTGQVAVPLSKYVRRVVAIDPQPQMLELAAETARAAGVANIEFRLGDSTRLAESGVAGAHLVTFAASFHWTDRCAVLRELDDLLPAGAAVAVIDYETEPRDPDWERAIAEVRTRYLGPVRRAGSGVYRSPSGSHTEILHDSPFAAVERVSWPAERTLTVDEVVGLQFSYSFSTLVLLGEHAGQFAVDVRDAVLALYPEGTVVQRHEVYALLARRPAWREFPERAQRLG